MLCILNIIRIVLTNYVTLMRYFTPSEFKKCSPSCDISQMDQDFLNRLDGARYIANVPFVLLSAFRSSDYDISKGRSGKGYHCKGRAVDVKCTDGLSRWKIVFACLSLNLSVGIYPTFIHIDNRSNPIMFYGK